MKEIMLVALVAIVALVSITFMGQPSAQGAFITRPALHLLEPLSTPVGLCNEAGLCQQPSCPTGLVRVQLYEEGLPRYQYVVIPQYVLGSALGNCCSTGTTLSFSAAQEGEQKSLRLQCEQGVWKAFI